MRSVMAVAAIMAMVSTGLADETDRVKQLEKRVAELEARLAKLEAAVGPVLAKAEAEQRVNMQRAKARQRIKQDAQHYSQAQLKEVESLYQVANRNWKTEEGKASLEKLIGQYDKANRTGCAMLYLGQLSQGDQKVLYLLRAIKDHSDCFYGNGVQVGAYARMHLAWHFQKVGEQAKATALFDEIRQMYPEAIDHKGRALVDLMPK